MPIPVQGVLAALNMTAWVGRAPGSGEENACLLLATHDQRAEETMLRLATTLGLADPVPPTRLTLTDNLATLHIPTGSSLRRPVDAGWAALARKRGRAVLAIGFLPMRPGMSATAYAESANAAGKLVTGILPITAG